MSCGPAHGVRCLPPTGVVGGELERAITPRSGLRLCSPSPRPIGLRGAVLAEVAKTRVGLGAGCEDASPTETYPPGAKGYKRRAISAKGRRASRVNEQRAMQDLKATASGGLTLTVGRGHVA